MTAIKIESSEKQFSAFGGTLLADGLYSKSGIAARIDSLLPRMSGSTTRNQNKFRQMVLGFCAGAECLDDMASLHKDLGFDAICWREYSPKTYGNFLRSFSTTRLKELNSQLAALAFELREKLLPDACSITIDIDSTSHLQYGKKTEGVLPNYEHVPCLDSMQVFDELGLQYWQDVRPGNTYTSKGCTEVVHRVWNQIPKTRYYKNLRRYSRADSGFCQVNFFNACAAKNVGFVTCMRQQMLTPNVQKIRHWDPAGPQLKFRDGRGCEIAETIYRKQSCHQTLRVVVLRARKKPEPGALFEDPDPYDYRAWISNIGEHEMSAKKLILFYRGRGQAENYIKELKYGFDLKHFPCLSLDANKAYGIIVAFAHNLMRTLALIKDRISPNYAKKTRLRIIYLPVQVIHHAGQVVFRFMTQHFKEVNHWLEYIKMLQFGYA